MWFKRVKYFIGSVYFWLREMWQPSRISDARKIPIIINNFNRLETLKKLVERLQADGCENIHILDNASTYPPLLEYYRSCPCKVHFLGKNLGFKALWKSGLHKQLCQDYYVYTDSDVVPIDSCPSDYMENFRDALRRHPLARKVGFSLRIDDIPDHYAHKQKVIEKESIYYQATTDDGKLYRAPIDTTFAMYRPRVGLSRSRAAESYRTAYPYQAWHLPWYVDSANPSAEEIFYAQSTTQPTDWTSLNT